MIFGLSVSTLFLVVIKAAIYETLARKICCLTIVKFSATAASLENQNIDTRLISGQNAA